MSETEEPLLGDDRRLGGTSGWPAVGKHYDHSRAVSNPVDDPAVAPSDTPTRDLKIRLSPQKHVSREPGIQRYSWNITKETLAPNGVEKKVFLINGLFPGPTIEARSGDTLEIEVTNFAEEGVSLHWHGLHMRGANQMDGPVGITQCPIKPGTTFTYRVPVDEQAGTFWYHAHSEVHRGDGLYGGLVIHNPSIQENSTYRYDEELLFLAGDWYHWPSRKLLEWFEDRTSTGVEPAPDSLLVNGLGQFECSMAIPSSPVNCTEIERPWLSLDKKKNYRVRLVNVGSMAGFSFTIKDAEMDAIQIDGGLPITSHTANSIGVLYPAERVDFILRWPDSAADTDSEIIIELDDEYLVTFPNFALTPTQSYLLAAESNSRRPMGNDTEVEATRFDLREAAGLSLDSPLPNPQTTYMIYAKVQVMNQLDDEARSLVNQTIWAPQTLPLLALDRDDWDKHQLVPWTGSQPVWVELVINNIDTTGHPFHLHGFDFYVVSRYEGKNGWTAYNPFGTAPPRGGPFNLKNPIRKDTVYVPRSGYVVIRFLADNQGIWALHCHVLWHQASGMTMAFQVLGDERKGYSNSPAGIEAMQRCRA
ncbi:hypothetical protein GQ53DRAFT_869529 [Thozetella sp. PMI_491]|nr:hypothetical protein GQ53DRAFT_869529 [Thozetella sp. PMI_491]